MALKLCYLFFFKTADIKISHLGEWALFEDIVCEVGKQTQNLGNSTENYILQKGLQQKKDESDLSIINGLKLDEESVGLNLHLIV